MEKNVQASADLSLFCEEHSRSLSLVTSELMAACQIIVSISNDKARGEMSLIKFSELLHIPGVICQWKKMYNIQLS